MKCSACGAENAVNAARCEYCSSPLKSVALLDIAWSTTEHQMGLEGAGVIKLKAPSGTDPARAETLAKGAFIDGLRDQGRDESRILAAMRDRLARELPAEWELVDVTLAVTPVSAAAPARVEVDARPGSGPYAAQAPMLDLGHVTVQKARSGLQIVAACGLFAFSSCCILWGALFGIGGAVSSSEASAIENARVVRAAKAGASDGLVCIESTVAQVGSAVVVPGTNIACLYLEERIVITKKRTRVKRNEQGEKRRRTSTSTTTKGPFKKVVPSFTLGSLEVRPSKKTKWKALEEFPARTIGNKQHTYQGLRVDKPVTVMGRVKKGVMSSGDPAFIVTSQPSKADIANKAASAAKGLGIMTIMALVMGALGMLASLAAFFVRR